MLTGLAIATRTGGIITHVYLFVAMVFCAVELTAVRGALPLRYVSEMGMRYGTVVIIGWLVAIVLWPWLQIGNPLEQFKTALLHFSAIPMSFEFPHWGELIRTDALPWSYIPGQLLARLPEGFLLLLAVALIYAIATTASVASDLRSAWRIDRLAGRTRRGAGYCTAARASRPMPGRGPAARSS